MFKKLLAVFASILLIMLIWNWELVSYGLMQGRGQIKVIWESRPMDDFLSDPTFPDSLKMKLQLIREVKQFSTDNLGIKKGNSYESMFNQNGQVTLWNLTACQPFALDAKTWGFPMIGSFPYKGFFELEKAKKERDRLREEGFDTRIRPVSGWSTLGWFEDPILSNMLNRSEGALAELIIHELTHGTLYIKDSAEYNENLATFIGEKGAEQFLEAKYGPRSEQLNKYLEDKHDYEKFINHFIIGAKKLDSLYGTMNASIATQEKQELKKEMIQNIVQNIDTIKFYQPRKYGQRFKDYLPNNAYFMSFLRYHSKQGDFETDFIENFNGDVQVYLNYLKQKFPSL